MSAAIIAQAGIICFGFAAILCVNSASERLRRWASVLGLLAQPFWFYATFTTAQWGIFTLSFFYTFAWAKGFHRDWLRK